MNIQIGGTTLPSNPHHLSTTSPSNHFSTPNTVVTRAPRMTRREDSKTSRMTVPALPMPVAIFLCILNCLVPGLGTFLSGFCFCCCGNKRDMTGSDLMMCVCIQVLIAFGQLMCTPLFLMGWIWSIIWGIAFIGQSGDYYHNDPGRNDDGPMRNTDRSFSTTFMTRESHRIGPFHSTVQLPPYQEHCPNSVNEPPPAYHRPPPTYDEATQISTVSGAIPGQTQVNTTPPAAFSHPSD